MSSMVSSGSGIASSYYESRAQASVYEHNAEMAIIGAGMQEAEIRNAIETFLGRQKTLYAKAGVDITSGSPLAVMEDTAAEGEYRRKLVEWGGMEEARMNKWYSHVTKHAGDAAMSANITTLSAQILEMVAGGIGGGMAGGLMGGIAGAMKGASGGGGGWGRLLESINATRINK